MQGSTLMQLGQMDAQKYKQHNYGGFDLKGQSSRVKGQILKMLKFNRDDLYDIVSMTVTK